MDFASDAGGTPSLTVTRRDGSLALVAAGSWTVAQIDTLEPLVEGAAAKVAGEPLATLDLRAVGQLDTFGAVLLERLVHPDNGPAGRVAVTGLGAHLQSLYD